MKIITRKEALALGLKHYFTGKPCPKGHVAKRFVTSFGCIECTYEREKVKCEADPEYAAARQLARTKRQNERQRKRKAESLLYHEEYKKDMRERHAKRASFDQEYVKRKRKAAERWFLKNPECRRVYSANRRAKIKNGGTHTEKDVSRILNLQRHKCANCLTCIKEIYHVDHIMPIALGGSNWPENLQCLCPTCNLKKNAKHPIDWAQENGRLL